MIKTKLIWGRRGDLVEVLTYKDRTHRYYTSTGIHLTEEQWDKTRSCAIGAGSERINKILTTFLRDTMWQNEGKPKLTEALPWLLEQIEKGEQTKHTKEVERGIIMHVARFGGIKYLTDFTLAWITRWDDWLHNGKRMQTSISRFHFALRKHLNKAVKLGLLEHSPYDRFDLDRGHYRLRHALTEEQLDELRKLSLTKNKEKVRDLFLLMALTGLAFSDMQAVSIDKIHNGWYDALRQKTKTPFHAPFLPEAIEIIKKYNGVPHFNNSPFNQVLRELGKEIKLSYPLTSHIARHTFITLALTKGIAPNVVQRMVGHSSLAMTEVYTHLSNDYVEQGAAILFGK